MQNAKIKNQKGQKLRNLLPALALGVGLVGMTAILTRPVTADEGGPRHSIIQKLVERFGLNADEVEEVFEEDREDRRAEGQARFEERLAEAVAEGELTEDQKAAIIAKRAEMEANRQEQRTEMAGLSQEERGQAREAHREEMEAKREEVEAWAQENGIDLKYLIGFGGGFGKGRFGPPPGE
jgi:hypothetical protein